MKQGALAQEAAARGCVPWNGDHLRTRVLDAISLMLPAGEEFVIQAVADGLADASSHACARSALRAQAERFIAEERAHQRAHRLYNDRLAAEGGPAAALEQRMRAAVAELTPLGLRTRLALAAAFEHLTALLSRELLRGAPWLQDGDDSPQARMWRWHCREEIGHHHVAGELASACGAGYPKRAGCLVLASAYLLFDLTRLLTAMLRHDVRRGALRRRCLARQGGRFALAALPGLLRLARGWCGYLLPARHG